MLLLNTPAYFLNFIEPWTTNHLKKGQCYISHIFLKYYTDHLFQMTPNIKYFSFIQCVNIIQMTSLILLN